MFLCIRQWNLMEEDIYVSRQTLNANLIEMKERELNDFAPLSSFNSRSFGLTSTSLPDFSLQEQFISGKFQSLFLKFNLNYLQ